jgi:hypothetical protein
MPKWPSFLYTCPPRRLSYLVYKQYALSHPTIIEITNHSSNETLLFDVQSYSFPLPRWTREWCHVKTFVIREDPPYICNNLRSIKFIIYSMYQNLNNRIREQCEVGSLCQLGIASWLQFPCHLTMVKSSFKGFGFRESPFVSKCVIPTQCITSISCS